MKNKLWKEPELIILSRSQPREFVLTVCKNTVDAGPSYSHSDCFPQNGTCVSCDVSAAS
jgi:hypothetical protein